MTETKRWWWVAVAAILVVFGYSVFANVKSGDRSHHLARLIR